MLQARKIPQLLEGGLGDGITTVVLMTTDGSILSSVSVNPEATIDILVGALTSSFWSNVSKEQSELQLYIMKLEKGFLGVACVGKAYLVAAHADDTVSMGYLKARIEALKSHLNRVFDQLA